MRASGYEPEDFEDDDFEAWPDCWRPFRIFARVETQWNVGFGGRVGLRYEAVYPLIDREAGSAQEWDALLDDIQVMEGAALQKFSDDRS